MVKVKICGITTENDLKMCIKEGVDNLGIVCCYPLEVPWNVSLEKARTLVNSIPPYNTSTVVTGGNVDNILKCAYYVRPDIVQLHYNEDLKTINEVVSELNKINIKVIKALRIDSSGRCMFEEENWNKAVSKLKSAGVTAVIADSYTKNMPGGSGVKISRDILSKVLKIKSELPVILAGGLNPGNILEILDDIHPYAVDILSGVEVKPGVKDPGKVRDLIRKVHAKRFDLTI